MIPKIAHFHWTGRPMGWLRMASIASFKRHNPDWEIRLHDTPPEIAKQCARIPQGADWTWWRKLYEHGGFQVATDIIFIKPVPDEWLELPFNACTNGQGRIYQFAMLGCTPEHPYMAELLAECAKQAKVSTFDFQCFGVLAMSKIALPSEMFDQPMGALCPYDDSHCDRYWWEQDTLERPPECIGFHWYGGHPAAKAKERRVSPDDKSFICRLAMEQM